MLEIRFFKEKKHTVWDARRGRSYIAGAGGGGNPEELPHDLVGLVVERALGVEHGFWWAVDNGATFRSMGKKPTRPGRELIRRHGDEIYAADHLVHQVWEQWRRGEPTPCSEELDATLAEWQALPTGGHLVRTFSSPPPPRRPKPERRDRQHPRRARGGVRA